MHRKLFYCLLPILLMSSPIMLSLKQAGRETVFLARQVCSTPVAWQALLQWKQAIRAWISMPWCSADTVTPWCRCYVTALLPAFRLNDSLPKTKSIPSLNAREMAVRKFSPYEKTAAHTMPTPPLLPRWLMPSCIIAIVFYLLSVYLMVNTVTVISRLVYPLYSARTASKILFN